MVKNSLLTGLLFLFVSISAFAQPRALFEKTEHQFGSIEEIKGKVSVDYKFKNIGNQPLILTEVKPSCGCTEPEWTKDPVPPGGEGFIRATFDPAGRPGNFEKVVYVRTNGEPAMTLLLFSGTVVAKPFDVNDKYPVVYGNIRLEDTYMLFGEAFYGDIDTAYLKVFNQSANDVAVQAIVGVPDYIRFEIPDRVIKARSESIIKAVLDTKKANIYGEMNYTFYMQLGQEFSNEIPIYAMIHVREMFPELTPKYMKRAPRLMIDATQLDLGKILHGDSVEFAYTVTNMGKDPLIIRNVVTRCGCTVSKVEKSTLKHGESTMVKAVFYTQGRVGDQEKYLYIITNDPLTPELRVGFTANIVENPEALKY